MTSFCTRLNDPRFMQIRDPQMDAPPRIPQFFRIASHLVLITTLAISNCVGAESPSATSTWSFDGEVSGAVGNVRTAPGPRSPEFPDFDQANNALKFDGRGSRIVIPQSQDDSSLQFGAGDEITIAAWIAPRRGGAASHRYIIGKGRTGSKGFRQDNQNWALRLTPKGNGYHPSFLFATADGPSKVQWHRWTSDDQVLAGDGWHHVAVSYRFGEPESLRAWIDAKPVAGRWDMSGPTTAAPIVDSDAVWIGSSMGGSTAASFLGLMDLVSVERKLLDDDTIAKRYRRDESIPRVVTSEKPTMPVIAAIAPGTVLTSILEGLPVEDMWPDRDELESLDPPPVPHASWQGDSFLQPRIPMRYDNWGIRSDWKPPVLLRVAADVQLPTGNQRFMVRARSLGRLWIDGALVAQTQAQTKKAPSGEEPITPLASPPHPGVRVKGYRQQEVIVEHTIPGDGDRRICRVVLELIAGGKQARTETGEFCVAIETPDGQSFDVLVPVDGALERLPLRDPQAAAELDRAETRIAQLEQQTRRQLASSEDDFWQNRHAIAKQWCDQHPPPAVPVIGDGNRHPIDAFIEHRIANAKQKLATTKPDPHADAFRTDVLPILQTHCLRCHGKAEKGGLRLDSLAASIAGGDSGWAAIVPGKPDESELVLRLLADDPAEKMPLGEAALSDEQTQTLVDWIRQGAPWPEKQIDPEALRLSDPIDDAGFLRRVALDTIGMPLTESETREFLSADTPDKRRRLIDRMLDDDRVADHLVADWLDLLAENPTLLNTSLNSTGPFRFFLHDALVDRKPIDRMVSELVMMRGDRHTGGSAGFSMAGENDSPLAAKAHVLASGLLGIDLQCARCHDAPFHSTTQEDLFSIAAMLNRNPLSVPETSRVPATFFEKQQRESLIEVTLASGRAVEPKWTLDRFTGVADDAELDKLTHTPSDQRDRLAALLTSPANERFAAVIVNRVWTHLMGAGLVGSLNDWEHVQPNDPDLLQWLAHDFVSSGYDVRHLMRTIMTSDAYQRSSVDASIGQDLSSWFFAAPVTRRLTAEQIVDSMFAATGRGMDSEELTFVHDGRRPLANRLTLGVPSRAWMMATLNNERDRPSLSLPRARAIVDVLQAFGWNGSRQKPVHDRETESNVLQPGILANGVLSASLSRAAMDSPLADLAVQADSAGALIDSLFLRFLSRMPSDSERIFFADQLDDGFEQRVIAQQDRSQPASLEPLPLVHWFNHLRPRANEIQQEIERRVRQGPPADPRLQSDWRGRYEDVVWSLLNHDEFVWMP